MTQATRDALADAETLRLFLRTEHEHGHTAYVVATPAPIGARSARAFASAAFRLVPALRGE